MKRLILLINVFMFFTGCISFQTKIDDKLLNEHLTKKYNYSKTDVMKATAAALREQKTALQKFNLGKGLIITEKTMVYEIATRVAGGVALKQYWHKYYIQIRGNNKASVLKVYKYRVWENTMEMDSCHVSWNKENLWNPLFKEIDIKLSEMKI